MPYIPSSMWGTEPPFEKEIAQAPELSVSSADSCWSSHPLEVISHNWQLHLTTYYRRIYKYIISIYSYITHIPVDLKMTQMLKDCCKSV